MAHPIVTIIDYTDTEMDTFNLFPTFYSFLEFSFLLILVLPLQLGFFIHYTIHFPVFLLH